MMKLKIPKLRFDRTNGLTFGLLFVIMASENFGYLIPHLEEMAGPLKYSDIGFLSAVVWTIVVFLKKIKRINFKKTTIIPLLYIPIVFLSGRVAQEMFGQSMILSLIINRRLIAAILLYYAIVIALKERYITENDFIRILFIQATIELIIDYLQYFMADIFQFTYFQMDERYMDARVRAAYLLPLAVGYLSLNKVLHKKNMGFYALYTGLSILLVIVVCKHRAPTIWIIVTIGCAYLLWKKNLGKKIIIGMAALIIVCPIVYNLPIVQDSIRTASSQSMSVNSLIVREKARDYYLLQLLKSPLLGFSEPYTTALAAVNNSGRNLGYIRADNGVVGFMYAHGVIGLIWLLLFFVSAFGRSIFVYRKLDNYAYLLYFTYEIMNLYIGMHWYYDYQYVLFLVLALLEYDYYKAGGYNKNGSGKHGRKQYKSLCNYSNL